MKNYFFKIITVFTLIICFIACSENDEPEITPPTVISNTTIDNVEITFTTIKINGIITPNEENEIISRGICWSTNENPTINDNKTTETLNTFSSIITGLTANTMYYFKVYATDNSGTNYSSELSFSTSSLENSTWDFLLIHDPNTSTGSWNADVTFNPDGTTIYDEPSNPGAYLTNGTWSLDGNNLTYDLDSSETTNTSYQFTGVLDADTMSGTYTFNGTPDKTWTATKY
ncbi:hypothetical protein [Tenacibaculum insulae]|uniref:hypothetical protein n=1 Tax=Tenacibaculum insulae TaxID=2029677 RepID=UPI003AB88CE2